MASIEFDEEFNLHLREEGVLWPEICARIKLQTPHHPPIRMLPETAEELGEGGTRLRVPDRDAAVCGGKPCECSGTVGTEEVVGESKGGGWAAGCLIEDMTGYRVSLRDGCGLVHFLLFNFQHGFMLILIAPILML